jgi:hypothetical protein
MRNSPSLPSPGLLTCDLIRYILTKEGTMKKAELTSPEIALIAGTRGMIGAGAGLLLADKLNNDQRRAIGWTLLIIGAISTIPLAIEVFGKRQ